MAPLGLFALLPSHGFALSVLALALFDRHVGVAISGLVTLILLCPATALLPLLRLVYREARLATLAPCGVVVVPLVPV